MNARIFCVMLAAALAFPVAAQTFPSKPVRIFVVYPPGGTSDAVTRLPHVGNVPYDALKDIAPLAGGQFELFTANPSPGVNTMLQQGRLRILAVAAPKRLAALPSTPGEFGQVVRREYEANAKVVAKAGIRSE